MALRDFIRDEQGFFILGPLWFVVLVGIIYFIYSLTRDNPSQQSYQTSNLHNYHPVLETECPSCGSINPQQARFCINCRYSFLTRTCPQCGTENVSDARYCQECALLLT